jgi:hypothetical protein
MVGMTELSRQTGVPRWALYRLVDAKKIPYQEEPPKAWQLHRARNLLFRVSEVEAALAALRERR